MKKTHLLGLFFSGKIREMKLSLALAQLSTKLGDVEANLEKHLNFIEQARAQKADLLVFPELSLTGYVLQDLVASVYAPAGSVTLRCNLQIRRS
jgi:predicted amidohydrolase